MRTLLHNHYGKTIGLALFAGICVWLGVRVELRKADVLNAAMDGRLGAELSLIRGLFLLVAVYLLLYAVYLVVSRVFINGVVRQLRLRIFAALLRDDRGTLSAASEGEILSKYTAHVNELKVKLLRPVAQLFVMVLQCIFVTITFLRLNVSLAVLSAVIFTLAVLVPKIYESIVSREAEHRVRGFAAHLEDFNNYIGNMELIKNAHIELSILRKFERSLNRFFGNDLRLWKARSASFGIGYFVMLAARSLILIYTAYLVWAGDLSPGLFFAVVGLVESMQTPLFWMSKLYQDMISARPVIRSIEAFLGDEVPPDRTPRSVIDAPAIRLEDVTYTAGDRVILDGVRADFPAGGKFLITGRSGSGKTTIANLLLKTLSPDAGAIYFDDQPIAAMERTNDRVVVARQEAKIFNIGLKNNVTLFQPMEDATLSTHLRQVGLEALTDDRAAFKPTALSGGEKKRLSLLRAICNRKPILVLDEPLANIDPENVDRIEDLILDLDDVTLIVISHTFSPDKLYRFDRIFRLEDGQLA